MFSNLARPPATMVAKTATIAIGGSQYGKK
jgi:hypothetical protein